MIKRKNFIILFLILFIVLSLYVYNFFIKDENNIIIKKMKNDTSVVLPDVDKYYVPDGKYSIDVYKVSSRYSKRYGMLCIEKNSNCDVLALSIPVSNDNAMILDINDKQNFILYKDKDIFLYYVKSRKVKKLKINNNYYSYKIGYDNIKNNVIGIIFKNKSTSNYSYYNIQLDKIIVADKYEELIQLDNGYLQGIVNNTSYLVDNGANEEYLSNKGCNYYNIQGDIKKYFIILDKQCNNNDTIDIYTSNFNLLVKNIKKKDYSLDDQSYLYVNNKNRVVKYDVGGNKIDTSDRYDDIKELIQEYAVVIKDNKIQIVSNNNFVVTLGKWKKNYVYDTLSGYHNRGNREGIYVIVRYKIDSLEGIEYFFNPYTGSVEKKELETIMED